MISGEYISAFGAVSVAVLAWLGGRYLKSGRIRTSEAEQLWRAAEALREEGRKDRESLREDIRTLRTELEAVQQENRRLEGENYTLTKEVRSLKLRLGELERQT